MSDELRDLAHYINNSIDPVCTRDDANLIESASSEIERLRSDLQTMVAETQSLIALITAWADAEDEADMIRGIDLFTAYEALRKAVGR